MEQKLEQKIRNFLSEIGDGTIIKADGFAEYFVRHNKGVNTKYVEDAFQDLIRQGYLVKNSKGTYRYTQSPKKASKLALQQLF